MEFEISLGISAGNSDRSATPHVENNGDLNGVYERDFGTERERTGA
jgi:hypothetical protein